MATITLKDQAAANVVFTLIGGDANGSRYSALALNTSTEKYDVVIAQQRAAFGSAASSRATAKVGLEKVDSSGNIAVVRKSSVSTLITQAPGVEASEMLDLIAMQIELLTTHKQKILDGLSEL